MEPVGIGGERLAETGACKLCKFWEEYLEYPGTGECRRHAPIRNPQALLLQWPVTNDLDWCGDYEAPYEDQLVESRRAFVFGQDEMKSIGEVVWQHIERWNLSE